MIVIEYRCKRFVHEIVYTLIQHAQGESFQIYHQNTLIGSVIKVSEHCVQVSGRTISEEMLADICNLI